MEMSGTQNIAAPKQAVWDALNDPEVLKNCITGCQSLEKTSETHLEAKVKAAVGPVKATFKGEVDLEDVNPPHSYTLVGQGKGGAAGFAKGSAAVKLDEEDGGTLLRYDVKASIGGQLARIGSRLVDGAAKKYADEFFAAFKAHVEASESDAPQEDPAATPDPLLETETHVITPEPEVEQTGGIPAFVWGGALAVAVVLAVIWLL